MIPRCFTLKNGSTAVLRTAVPEDAAQMIAYLRACAEETDFLLRLPEEWDISVETEEALLRDMAHQTENRMLVCSVKGEIAGTCQVACMNRLKTRAPRHGVHRAAQGVLGSGHFRRHVRGNGSLCARTGRDAAGAGLCAGKRSGAPPLRPAGLCGNGPGADAIRLRDGTLLDEIFMVKKL